MTDSAIKEPAYYIRRPSIEVVPGWEHGKEHIRVEVKAASEHDPTEFGTSTIEALIRLAPVPRDTPLAQIERLADEAVASALEAIAAGLRKRAAEA